MNVTRKNDNFSQICRDKLSIENQSADQTATAVTTRTTRMANGYGENCQTTEPELNVSDDSYDKRTATDQSWNQSSTSLFHRTVCKAIVPKHSSNQQDKIRQLEELDDDNGHQSVICLFLASEKPYDKPGCSMIMADDTDTAVKEAFEHMDAAILAADISTNYTTTAAIPDKNFSSVSLKVSQNCCDRIKISNGKFNRNEHFVQQNGLLDKKCKQVSSSPEIKQTKISNCRGSSAVEHANRAISVENLISDDRSRVSHEKRESADRKSILIASNLNSPPNCVTYCEYKPKIQVKSFEDEYYAKEMKTNDEYLHTIKFGYRDLDSTDLPEVPVLNRCSVPSSCCKTQAQEKNLNIRKPQAEKRFRNRTTEISGLNKVPAKVTTIERPKIGDLHSAKRSGTASNISEKFKGFEISEAQNDDPGLIYSTVKQRLFKKECEKFEMLLDEWRQKTRISGLVLKRGSEISDTELAEIENLKRALLDQREVVRKLCPSKIRPSLPPDFCENSPKLSNEKIIPVQVSTCPAKSETADKFDESEYVSVYKMPQHGKKHSFYKEFSRSKSPETHLTCGDSSKFVNLSANQVQETSSRYFDVPIIRNMAPTLPLSSIKHIDIQSAVTNNSKSIRDAATAASQPSLHATSVSPASFTVSNDYNSKKSYQQHNTGDAINDRGLYSCSSLRRWNFRRPLTSSAWLQGDLDCNWHNTTDALSKLHQDGDLSWKSNFGSDSNNKSGSGLTWIDKKDGETVYCTQYEKIETTTSTNKTPIYFNGSLADTNNTTLDLHKDVMDDRRMTDPSFGIRSNSHESLMADLGHFGGVKNLRKRFR